MNRRSKSAAILWLLSSVAPVAGAQTYAQASVPTRVELHAPEGCPSAAAFLEQVGARAAVRPAHADEPAYTLLVQVERRRQRYIGLLGSGSTTGVAKRQLEAAKCKDVMAALALSAALALETGQWELAPPPSASPPSDVPASDVRHEDHAGVELARERAVQSTPLTPAVSADAEGPPAPAQSTRSGPDASRQRSLRLSLGASGTSVALPVLLGPALAIEYRAAQRRWALRGRFSYAFELGGASQHVELALPAAGLDLCPYALAASNWMRVWLCVSTDVGLLQGRGRALARSDTAFLLYGSSGVVARLEWPLGSWALELWGGPQAVWSRPQFRYGSPPRSAQNTSPLAISAGALVTRRFW